MAISKRKRYIFLMALTAILVLGYSHYEIYRLKTKAVNIVSQDLPEAFKNKTIVFISDVHLGPYMSQKRVHDVVERINAMQPDIIILGGDYIDIHARYIDPVFDELQKLKAKHGIYAVLGNHEYIENESKVRQRIRKAGFYDCDNQGYWVRLNNDSIKIGGVGDLWEADQHLNNTINDVDTSDFCILISHNPDYAETISTSKVDLTLSGHTHGGQVTFFGLWAPILPSEYGQKYRYGLKKLQYTQVYITSGVGAVGVPFRFFCRPEIAVLTLKTGP